MNRRVGRDLDVVQWPTFDASALPAAQRKTFAARRQAVEMYAGNATLAAIEETTGVVRCELYRLLDRCVTAHDDGRQYGWRALVPYVHVAEYQRVSRLAVRPGGAGAAGAFGALMERFPVISEWIEKQVHAKKVAIDRVATDGALRLRLRGLNALHADFLKLCRTLGLTAGDYPFNTERLAIRSLSAAVRAACLTGFERTSHLAGAQHLKGLPKDAKSPAASQALEVVEFDGHRLDVRLKVVVRDPLGFEQEFEIERIWLLVILDVFSRAVLGYHVSLNREYSRYDVIRTIEAALEPHRPRAFTLPGVGYGPLGGFPSMKLPELGYASWQWFKLDNSKANLADDVRHALTEFLCCFIDAGPARTPDDRPYIERFFASIATNLSARLPGYTGSDTKDLRRALSDPKGNLRLYVSLTEIEELLEAAIAGYNAGPHDGLNGRTPLEAIEHSVRQRGALLNWLPEAKRRTLCLMQTPKRATVRGYPAQGQRPHINFYSVRYTSATLAGTMAFLGRELRIYYNSQDLRTVRAFAPDGTEIGALKAQGAWGEIAHDLKLRQEIVRLRGRKRLKNALTQEFLQSFIDDKVARAKHRRRAASDLAQTLRTLVAAPTSTSAAAAPVTPHTEAQPAIASPVPRPRVEPERLSIRSGYVGTV